MKRPNILLMMVDEMRYPPSYETDDIRKWRDKYLTAQNRLKKKGVTFTNHHTASLACAPARASLFTGQYPSLHGVSQTDGAAKSAYDPNMFWLDPNTVPDMGDYFKKIGYKTMYKGKWHISAADILIPGTKNAVASYNNNGTVNQKNTDIYIKANKLEDFGFSGWVGPEPQGINPLNSGSSSSQKVNGRDIFYVEEVIELLDNVSNMDDPWLMVASLVNPHDITLYGEVTNKMPIYNFDIDPSVPHIPAAPSSNDDLTTKPQCQSSYKNLYQQGFQPTVDTEQYRQLYYSLNLTADRNINKILQALDKNNLTENTIVIFTSDHGDFVGAHGLFQKWYTAYQEAIHVPLIIQLPKKMYPDIRGTKIDQLTSHIDILPTILGLVNADTSRIQKKLKNSFTNVHPLVGRDLSALIYGFKQNPEPILFTTDDNVLFGNNMISITGTPYQPIIQPASIQTVIVQLEQKQIWKFSRYYDNPNFWTVPNTSSVIQQNTNSVQNNDIIINTSTTKNKTNPAPDEYELYCLSTDPIEMINYANPKYATEKTKKIEEKLRCLLNKLVSEKCIVPNK